MDKQPIIEGAKRRLYWIADDAGAFRAKTYYDDLDPKVRARFHALFNRMATHGHIHNATKFRQLSQHMAYFKVRQHRLTCFEDDQGNLLLITGFIKKTDKDTRYRRHIETAEGLRDRYLQRKGSDHEADSETRA